MPVINWKSLSVNNVTPLARSESYSGVECTCGRVRRSMKSKYCEAVMNIIYDMNNEWIKME